MEKDRLTTTMQSEKAQTKYQQLAICSRLSVSAVVCAALMAGHIVPQQAFATSDTALFESIDHFESNIPQEDVFHVIDPSEEGEQGNAITRFLKQLGRGLRGQPMQTLDPELADAGPFAGPDEAQEVDVSSVSLDSVAIEVQQQQGATRSNKDYRFSLQTRAGYDARIQKANGFRVLDKPAEREQRTLSVHHNWQKLSDVLLPQEKWQIDENDLSQSPLGALNIIESNGFSFGVVDASNIATIDDLRNDYASDLGDITASSPNLVLSWVSPEKQQGGQYSLSAIGRKLSTQGYYEGQYVDNESYGWGVNLAGDWRFGGLNAGLSVAMGEGIDSVFLADNATDIYMNDNGFATSEVVSVIPSIGFKFANSSTFQVAYGRYQNNTSFTQSADTLDTVHFGYSWSAWSDSTLGVELIEQRVQGDLGDLQDDQQVRFGIRKNF